MLCGTFQTALCYTLCLNCQPNMDAVWHFPDCTVLHIVFKLSTKRGCCVALSRLHCATHIDHLPSSSSLSSRWHAHPIEVKNICVSSVRNSPQSQVACMLVPGCMHACQVACVLVLGCMHAGQVACMLVPGCMHACQVACVLVLGCMHTGPRLHYKPLC